MKIPTIQEIQAYIDDRGYDLDAQSFWYFYEQKGWLVGKTPMKRWKAAVSLWATNGWGKTGRSRARLASRNVQTADKEREFQRQLFQEYLKSKTIRALQDLKQNPGGLRHVIWLMDEVIEEKGRTIE